MCASYEHYRCTSSQDCLSNDMCIVLAGRNVCVSCDAQCTIESVDLGNCKGGNDNRDGSNSNVEPDAVGSENDGGTGSDGSDDNVGSVSNGGNDNDEASAIDVTGENGGTDDIDTTGDSSKSGNNGASDSNGGFGN